MSFELSIPQHITTIEQAISGLQMQIANLVHVCNCDYCEVSGEVPKEHIKAEKALEQQIAEHRTMINKLKAHAKLHGVNLEN